MRCLNTKAKNLELNRERTEEKKWNKTIQYYKRATTRIFFSFFIVVFFSTLLYFTLASAWALLQYLLKWRLRKCIHVYVWLRAYVWNEILSGIRVRYWACVCEFCSATVIIELPSLGLWFYTRIYIYICVYDARIHA